jgi:hypothetical protein
MVTGYRAPWSSHMAVIPRFRAMSPVRREFGVHCDAGPVGSVDVDGPDVAFAFEEADVRSARESAWT